MKFGLVLVVFTGLLLLSAGCVSIPKAENASIELANKTTEGRALFVFRDAFSKTPQCTVEEYTRSVSLIKPILSKTNPTITLSTDPAQANQVVELSKQCNPTITIVSNPSENGFSTVSYSISTSSACPIPETAGKSATVAKIKTNESQQTAEVVLGSLPESKKKVLENVLPGVPLLGNCAAPVLVQAGMVNDFSTQVTQ